MKEQLLATWHTHNKMNYLLIDNITDAGMEKTVSTRGGRTVYEQWVHIHNVRMQWLEICAKDFFPQDPVEKSIKHWQKKQNLREKS